MVLTTLMVMYVRHEFIVFSFTERYYDMRKENCKATLDVYKKFLSRTNIVNNFLKVAKVFCILIMVYHRDDLRRIAIVGRNLFHFYFKSI